MHSSSLSRSLRLFFIYPLLFVTHAVYHPLVLVFMLYRHDQRPSSSLEQYFLLLYRCMVGWVFRSRLFLLAVEMVLEGEGPVLPAMLPSAFGNFHFLIGLPLTTRNDSDRMHTYPLAENTGPEVFTFAVCSLAESLRRQIREFLLLNCSRTPFYNRQFAFFCFVPYLVLCLFSYPFRR